MSVTPFHRNVFTRIRFWLQKYLVFDSVDLELKKNLFCDFLYLDPDMDLTEEVSNLTTNLLSLAQYYKGDQKRIVCFMVFFLNRNCQTSLTKVADKRLDELIGSGELSESMRKLYTDPNSTLSECLPSIKPLTSFGTYF